MVQVSPSLLAADFSDLRKEIESISEADLLHFDVMDGTFVPNLSFGPAIATAVKRCTDCPLDVHLMLERPENYIETFAKAGADLISFHLESLSNPDRTLDLIHSFGIRAGLVINPSTPAEALFPYLGKVELFLVMTVQPGFGGQICREECFEKCTVLRDECRRRGISALIEVDGGIGIENASRAVAAGANVLVAGSSVFKAPDRNDMIRRLKRA